MRTTERQPLTPAQQALAGTNVRLVTWYLRRYYRVHPRRLGRYPWPQAESAAYLGLCEAARRYDPARGVRFATFAFFHLKLEVMKGWKELAVVHVPDDRNQRGPDRYRGVKRLARSQGQFPVGGRGSPPCEHLLAGSSLQPLDALVEAERERVVREAVARLPASMRRVVRWRLEGLTLREIGLLIGRSKERVRQVEAMALDLLREQLEGVR